MEHRIVEESDEDRRLRQIEINRPLSDLLDSWLNDNDESEEEQRAALDALMRGIDEHRTEETRLFSEYLN